MTRSTPKAADLPRGSWSAPTDQRELEMVRSALYSLQSPKLLTIILSTTTRCESQSFSEAARDSRTRISAFRFESIEAWFCSP
jgi:hypothetical protein